MLPKNETKAELFSQKKHKIHIDKDGQGHPCWKKNGKEIEAVHNHICEQISAKEKFMQLYSKRLKSEGKWLQNTHKAKTIMIHYYTAYNVS